MRPRRLASRIVAPIVALMMLLVGLRSAHATYTCKGDGVMRTMCCCPQADDSEKEPASGFEAPCCCDVRMAAAVQAADARVQSEASLLRAVVAVVRVGSIQPRIVESVSSPAWVNLHPPPGPPLLVLKQSFLL